MHRSLSAALVFCAVLGAALLASVSGLEAQTTPVAPQTIAGADYENRWDLFGGFSYSYFSTSIGHGLRTNLQGLGGQGTVWFSPIAGLSAAVRQVSGHITVDPNTYGITTPRISETLFLFGPDVRVFRTERLTIGGHLLIGGTYGIFDTDLKGTPPNFVGLYNNQLAFASAVGGSFDYNVSPHISVRVITDFQPTFFGSSVQKEFGGQAGIVYKIGSLRKQ